MSSPPCKRRRFGVTVQQKKDICWYKATHPKGSLDVLAKHFSQVFGHAIGKSTVSDILRDKEKWLEKPDQFGHLTRSRSPKHDQLEKELFDWFRDQTSKYITVTDKMVIDRARIIGAQLEIKNFGYSSGWLYRFKSRHNIKQRKVQADSGGEGIVSLARLDLNVLANYEAKDIFNLSETALFFKLGPSYTLASKPVSVCKRSKERITVALCANANGTVKLKPFVITKHRRPQCFGEEFDPEMYVRYRHSTKAWMTDDMFRDWLAWFDRRMRSRGRHVILFVENASRHRPKEQFSNVTMHQLPPDTINYVQPSGREVIRTFKAHYRKKLLRHYLECAENGEAQVTDLRLAIRQVKEAWLEVTPMTIAISNRHRCVAPSEDGRLEDPDGNKALLELGDAMIDFIEATSEPIMPLEDFLDVDKDVSTGEPVMDGGHGDRCVDGPLVETDSSSDDEATTSSHSARKIMSRCEHRVALIDLLCYYEDHGDLPNVEKVLSMMKTAPTKSLPC